MADRFLLNAHYDVTNVVKGSDFSKVCIDTLDIFIEQLTRICGPYSRQALILRTDTVDGMMMSTSMDTRLFMRDGAHILAATECVSPVQQYLKSIIHYIGRRIDSVCKDGTTTSMLFACQFIRELILRKEMLESFTLIEIEEELSKLFSLIGEKFDRHILTADAIAQEFACSKQKAAAALTFMQAYTATGGDLEISTSIAEFFRRTPQEVWKDSISHTTAAIEQRDFRCKVEESDAEFVLKTILLTNQHRNYEMGRYIKYDSADVLILSTDISDESLLTDELLQYIKEKLEPENPELQNKEPLVLLVPNVSKCISDTIVELLNAKSKQHSVPIVILGYSLRNNRFNMPWTALSVCGKANVPLYDEATPIKESVIHGVSVFVTNQETRLDNISPLGDDADSVIHPGMLDPEKYPHHKRAYDLISRDLENATLARNEIPEELEDLRSAMSELTVRKKLVLRLGGLCHEQHELLAIIEDAAGSALVAATTGVVTNALSRFLRAVFECRTSCENSFLRKTLLKIIEEAATRTIYTLCGPNKKCDVTALIPATVVKMFGASKISIHDDPFEFLDLRAAVNLKRSHGLDCDAPADVETWRECVGNIRNDIDDLLSGKYVEVANRWRVNGYPPVQTAKMTGELCDRLREVGLRVGLLDMFIVPGGAWTEDSGGGTR